MKRGERPLRKRGAAPSPKPDPRRRLRLRRQRYRTMLPETSGAQRPPDRSLSRILAEREQQIAKLTTDLANWRDLTLRARADFENARKRFQREKQDITNFATEQLIRELTPVVDNLERALAAASMTVDPKAVHDGVQLLLDHFLNILRANGLEIIQPDGQVFDPHFHEAVAAEERDDIPSDNLVLETLQKGFILRGRVVRPAMVRVGRLAQKTPAGETVHPMRATGTDETLADFDDGPRGESD